MLEVILFWLSINDISNLFVCFARCLQSFSDVTHIYAPSRGLGNSSSRIRRSLSAISASIVKRFAS